MVGVVVVAVALVAAIAKPWDQVAPAPDPIASPAALVVPDLTPAPTPHASSGSPDWITVTDAALHHDAWGVIAVLIARRDSSGVPVSPPPTRYIERWTPTATDPSGADVAYLDREDAPIAALGVTMPDQVQAKSVRIWRMHANDEWEWVYAARIDNLATNRAPLLVRMPLLDGERTVPWDAGRYRVDVLTTSGIHRISVLVPNQFGNVPRPDEWAATAPDVVPAAASNPSQIRVGLFATVDGAAVPLAARQSPPLGEAQAWGDEVFADGSIVATTYLPRATGLGVMLTSHAAVSDASIRRLAPDPLPDPPAAAGGISDAHGRTPFIVFAAPGGGVWAPGVYAVTVDWKDAAGAHHATWHVDLRPGVG